MDELKRFYRQALPARIAALEAAREGARRLEPDALASVRRLAHSLKGSGATYGFPEVTAAARRVEEAPDAEIPALIDSLVAVLRQVVGGP
jgi:HPt (histidine-containing phosphotransfer) domain-containing protein